VKGDWPGLPNYRLSSSLHVGGTGLRVPYQLRIDVFGISGDVSLSSGRGTLEYFLHDAWGG